MILAVKAIQPLGRVPTMAVDKPEAEFRRNRYSRGRPSGPARRRGRASIVPGILFRA